MFNDKFAKIAGNQFIHLTTRGRRTGRPHTVELWFATADGKVYLSHEGRETDWMENINKNPEVTFEIGGKQFKGRSRILQGSSEETWVGKVALYEKYYGKTEKEAIEDWFSLSKLLVIDAVE